MPLLRDIYSDMRPGHASARSGNLCGHAATDAQERVPTTATDKGRASLFSELILKSRIANIDRCHKSSLVQTAFAGWQTSNRSLRRGFSDWRERQQVYSQSRRVIRPLS